MLVQLIIGTLMLFLSIIIAALGFWIIETSLHRLKAWLPKKSENTELVFFLSVASIWVLVHLTVGIWVWAFCYWWLGVFETIEASLYFSLVSFTTLGFGDDLLPFEWRLLGGLTAVNGLVNVGLVTAILVEFLRQARLEFREKNS